MNINIAMKDRKLFKNYFFPHDLTIHSVFVMVYISQVYMERDGIHIASVYGEVTTKRFKWLTSVLFLQFLREYQDEQVGALDGEDIDGYVDEESLLFKQVMDQSRKQMKEDSDEENTRIVKWIKDMQQQKGYGKEEKEEVCIFRIFFGCEE